MVKLYLTGYRGGARGVLFCVTVKTEDQMPCAHSRGARVGHASFVAVTMAHRKIYFKAKGGSWKAPARGL